MKFDVFEPGAATNWLGTPIDQPAALAELLERRGDLSVTGHPKRAPINGPVPVTHG